nr:hypothetical transcript [Hymenolepis microstoma]
MADMIYGRIYGCSDYRLYVTDQVSGANFLIDTGYSRSIIPLKLFERVIGDPAEYLKESQWEKSHGMVEMIVNFSLGRHLRWNFYVTDMPTPIIGADFLSYYNLVVDLKSRKLIDNHFKPTLFGPDLEDGTTCYQRPEVGSVLSKMVKHLQGHESPSEILNLMRRFVPWMALHDDIWKHAFLSLLTQSLQTVLKNKVHSHTISELAFQADRIYEEGHLKMNNRLYVTDPISHLKFLVDSGSRLSLIPSDEVLKPIPFTRFVMTNGAKFVEYGQKSITLDLGLNGRLTWNFVITNIPIPIIGADFLTYYELLIDLRRRRLIRKLPELDLKT